MSDQSKFYDYYMVDGDEVKSLIAGYDDIGEQRNSILPEAAGKVGAIAWTTSSGWGGGGGLLNGFVWDKGYQFPCPMTIKREEMFDGKRVVLGRGKGNTKEGRAFNKELDAVMEEANKKLKSLPEWKDYIVNHYGISELVSEYSLAVASVSRCYPRMAVSTRVVMTAWYSLSRTTKKSATVK